MRALLDTHTWIWMQDATERLGDAGDLIADVRNEFLLSAASSWEIAIKYALGRLRLPEPPSAYIPNRLGRSATTPIAIEHSQALRVADLPPIHRDPFDRLLIAQAQALGVPIVTADPMFARYDVEVITAG